MGLLDDAIREHLDLKRRRGADPTEVDQLERDALGPVRRGPQVSDEALPEEEQYEERFDHEERFDEEHEHEPHAERDEHVVEHEPFDERGPFGEDEPFTDPEPSERHGPGAVLYDDQADEPVRGSARSAPAPEFADESPESGVEERSWSYDSAEAVDVDEPRGPAEPAPPTRESPAAPPPEPAAPPPPPPPPARAERPPAPPEPGERPPEHAGQETVEYDVEAEHEGEQKDDDVLEETPEFLQDTPDHDRLWFEQRPPRPFDFDK